MKIKKIHNKKSMNPYYATLQNYNTKYVFSFMNDESNDDNHGLCDIPIRIIQSKNNDLEIIFQILANNKTIIDLYSHDFKNIQSCTLFYIDRNGQKVHDSLWNNSDRNHNFSSPIRITTKNLNWNFLISQINKQNVYTSIKYKNNEENNQLLYVL
jgi:hypothetical protein